MSDPIQQAGGELRLSLPWPAKELSPNASRHMHWGTKSRAVKKARQAAWAITREAVGPSMRCSGALLDVTFRPPSHRRLDIDNCIARAKSTFDGIADALGIDDSKFQATYSIGSPVKGGAVQVTIIPRGV